jgi:hypothetical protein
MKLKTVRTLASLFLTALLSATTIVPVSVERLTRESSHIVEGQATESWSQWNPQHSLIFTYTRFQVARALKGQAPSTIVVKQPGGSAEGYTQKIAGVRHWKTGDQAVLFLRPSQERDGTLEVTGLMQGNFLVHKTDTGEVMVSNGVPDVSAYQASSNAVTQYRGSGMRLDELESRIRKVARP